MHLVYFGTFLSVRLALKVATKMFTILFLSIIRDKQIKMFEQLSFCQFLLTYVNGI